MINVIVYIDNKSVKSFKKKLEQNILAKIIKINHLIKNFSDDYKRFVLIGDCKYLNNFKNTYFSNCQNYRKL